jgi:hypothetical protein
MVCGIVFLQLMHKTFCELFRLLVVQEPIGGNQFLEEKDLLEYSYHPCGTGIASLEELNIMVASYGGDHNVAILRRKPDNFNPGTPAWKNG